MADKADVRTSGIRRKMGRMLDMMDAVIAYIISSRFGMTVKDLDGEHENPYSKQ